MLFLFCCIVLTAFVLVPEIWGRGKTKDYPLWYWAGQQVLHGLNLYRTDGQPFDFIYPPLSAVLLAIPAWFGKIPLYLCLCLMNVIAWWVTILYVNAMTGSGRTPGMWLFALPGFVTITWVFDMFDLGQPNLVLLALMLYGFWSMQHQRPWMAGGMFALATAIKVFPVAVLPYLVWRRQWAALAGMLVFLGVFLFVVPAPVRGFQNNIAELKTWYQGMVASSSEKGFGQRDEQNWSWVNQSIIAMTHRLTRPINYNQDDPTRPVRTMNVVDISFKAANLLVVAISLVIGLGYHRGDAAGIAPDGEVGCRGDRHPVLPDDGRLAIGAAILLHVADLPDDRADASRRLRSAAHRAALDLACARRCRPA